MLVCFVFGFSACGGGNARSGPISIGPSDQTQPDTTGPAPDVKSTGEAGADAGLGPEGEEPPEGEPTEEPEEDMPDRVIREYYDPDLGDYIEIVDGRVLISMKGPPPPPEVGPNYFDDPEFEPPQSIYPAYPPVLEDPEVQAFLAETGAEPITDWLTIRAFAVYLPDGVTVEEAVALWPQQYDFIYAVEPDEAYKVPAFPQDPPNDYFVQAPWDQRYAWHLWDEQDMGYPGVNVMGVCRSGHMGSQDVVIALGDMGVQTGTFDNQYRDWLYQTTFMGVNVGDQRASTDFRPSIQGGGEGWTWVRNKSEAHAKWYGHGQNSGGIMLSWTNNDYDSLKGDLNDVAGVSYYMKLFSAAWKYTIASDGAARISGIPINNALDAIGAVKRVYDPIKVYGYPKGLMVPHYNIEIAILQVGGYSPRETHRRHFANLAGTYVPDRVGPILFVIPAGNEDTTRPACPANYPRVIAVGAYDRWGNRAHWVGGGASNYGPWVDVAAPTNVVSTDPLGFNSHGHTLGFVPPPYETYPFGGTCAAAAVTAGVAQLVQSKYKTWDPDQVQQRIVDTLVPLPNAPELPGRIDAFLACQ